MKLILISLMLLVSACAQTGFQSVATNSLGQSSNSADLASDTLIPPPGSMLPAPTTPRPSVPSEPTDPVTPPPLPPPPPAVPGGWNLVEGVGLCSGEAWDNGRVDCLNFQAICTGSTVCPFDEAIAVCSFTYFQGRNDFRNVPGAWEWFTNDMDHLAVGWGCQVQPRGTVVGNLLVDPSVFNAQYYLDSNPDLKEALGADSRHMASSHWRVYGINEGRRASPKFSAKIYLERYSDLRQAFGATNYLAATEHYVRIGRFEGRSGK